MDAHRPGQYERRGRRGLLLRGQHRAARAARALPGRDRAPSASALPFETEVLVLDNASGDGSAGAARRASGRRPRSIALRAAARQGRERHARCCSAPAGATPAAQRGLRAAARARPRRCTRRSTRARARRRGGRARCCAPTAAPQPSAWRFPTPGDRAGRRAAARHRRLLVQSRGDAHARGRLGAVGGAARARRGGARDRLVRPAFFVYSDEVDFCRRLRDAGWATLYVPARGGRPPRAALDRRRCPSGGSSSSRATATATCASTTRPARRRAVRWLTAWTYALRAARRARAARPQPAALLAPRDGDAAPGSRRGAARGGGGLQPRPAAVGARAGQLAQAARPPPAQEAGGEQQQRDRGERQRRSRQPAAPPVGQQQLAGDGHAARSRRPAGRAGRARTAPRTGAG